jgi:8-oxo-dGTP pyrophosphatase MutT (NUDIX family)
MQKWKKKSSKVIYTHPRITLLEDQVELPDGTLSLYVRFGGHKSAAMVFAIRDEQVLLQREYSYPPDEILYQLPGGAIEEGEDPETAAKRELIEESGYTVASLELLGWYYMDNRRSDARMYIYLATDVSPCERHGGDPEEFIESSWLPLQFIPENIRNGKIVNVGLLTAWAFFSAREKS